MVKVSCNFCLIKMTLMIMNYLNYYLNLLFQKLIVQQEGVLTFKESEAG